MPLKGHTMEQEVKDKISLSKRGHATTQKTKLKIQNTLKKYYSKNKVWNKGKKFKEWEGENSFAWKGDKITYAGIHSYIKLKFGKPLKCEECKTEKAKRYDWANVSGKYLRAREDWRRLCRKCHFKMDEVALKGWVTKKNKCKL